MKTIQVKNRGTRKIIVVEHIVALEQTVSTSVNKTAIILSSGDTTYADEDIDEVMDKINSAMP